MVSLSKNQEVWFRRLRKENYERGIISEIWQDRRLARLDSGEIVRSDNLLPFDPAGATSAQAA